MKALLKRVGEWPRVIDIPNEYAVFKEIIGGEPMASPTEIESIVVVADKAGDQKSKPKNFQVKNYAITGDAVMVAYRHIIFEGITEDEADRFVEYYLPEEVSNYKLHGKRGL